MKKILVPTDFSPNSYKALYFAVEIAKAAKAEILLMHVCDDVDSPFREKTALEIRYKLPLEDAVQKELFVIQKNVEENMKLGMCTQLYAGSVVPTIISAAAENNTDMIIMGTLGEAAFKEKLFGSVTAAVIGKANIPVLAVPLLSEWNIPRHILMVVNHFDEQPTTAGPVFEIAKMFNSKVTVAVFTDKDTAGAVEYLENTKGIMAYEEKLKTVYKDTMLEPAKLYGHKFQETLDEYINENNVDMLVMFTHKRNFMETIFNRSMTKKMSYHTNMPLLAVPVHDC